MFPSILQYFVFLEFWDNINAKFPDQNSQERNFPVSQDVNWDTLRSFIETCSWNISSFIFAWRYFAIVPLRTISLWVHTSVCYYRSAGQLTCTHCPLGTYKERWSPSNEEEYDSVDRPSDDYCVDCDSYRGEKTQASLFGVPLNVFFVTQVFEKISDDCAYIFGYCDTTHAQCRIQLEIVCQNYRFRVRENLKSQIVFECLCVWWEDCGFCYIFMCGLLVFSELLLVVAALWGWIIVESHPRKNFCSRIAVPPQ